jgi:hypothetical protein
MSGALTESIVPATYDELFAHYYPYVLKLIRPYIDEANVEDVAMTIIMKFIEKDVLVDYDPAAKRRDGSETSFITFLSGFVFAYLRGFVTTQQKQHYRYPISTDKEVTRSVEGGTGSSTWLDVYGGGYEEEFTDLTDAEFLMRVRAHLASQEHKWEKPVALLFEFIVMQLDEHARIRRDELAELFEVSVTTIFRMLQMLKSELTAVTAV